MKTCPQCGNKGVSSTSPQCICGYRFKVADPTDNGIPDDPNSQASGLSPNIANAPASVPGEGMGMSGVTLMLLGIGLVAWGLLTNTTVETGGSTSYGVYVPRSDVSNLSLMQLQTNLLIVGATSFIGGILLYVGGAIMKALHRPAQ